MPEHMVRILAALVHASSGALVWRSDAFTMFCPPAAVGTCGNETDGREVATMEQQLGTALDWLLEAHEFHCSSSGRKLIAQVFALLESLRLAACARRFRGCGPTMGEMLHRECHRADGQAQELIAAVATTAGAAVPERLAKWVPCRRLGGAVRAAVNLALHVGGALPAHNGPCAAADKDDLLLYPADRVPARICAANLLPLPTVQLGDAEGAATAALIPWRDITSHVPPGKLLNTATAVNMLRTEPSTFDSEGLGWVVNLGAADGGCTPGADYDPANCLALEYGSHRGVLVEGSQRPFRMLESRVDAANSLGVVPKKHIAVQAYVTPDTVVETLAAVLPTSEPALLKVDIDNADCSVVRRLTQVISPLMVHVEINPLLPPPLVFRRRFDDHKDAIGEVGRRKRLVLGHVSGCSLAALLEDVNSRRQGRGHPWEPVGDLPYELMHVEHANAVLLRKDAMLFLRRALGNHSATCAIRCRGTSTAGSSPQRSTSGRWRTRLSMRPSASGALEHGWIGQPRAPRTRAKLSSTCLGRVRLV